MAPSPVRRGTIALLSILFILSGCDLTGLGPPEDHSRFLSAALAGDGGIGIFTFTRLVYRPATGWRAFPDGGVPKYLVDEHSIGLFDLATRKLRLLFRRKNEYWDHESILTAGDVP